MQPPVPPHHPLRAAPATAWSCRDPSGRRATASSSRAWRWVVARPSLEHRQERVIERRSKLYGWRIVPSPSRKSTFRPRCFLTDQREAEATARSRLMPSNQGDTAGSCATCWPLLRHSSSAASASAATRQALTITATTLSQRTVSTMTITTPPASGLKSAASGVRSAGPVVATGLRRCGPAYLPPARRRRVLLARGFSPRFAWPWGALRKHVLAPRGRINSAPCSGTQRIGSALQGPGNPACKRLAGPAWRSRS
jgi:hypothetical protein